MPVARLVDSKILIDFPILYGFANLIKCGLPRSPGHIPNHQVVSAPPKYVIHRALTNRKKGFPGRGSTKEDLSADIIIQIRQVNLIEHFLTYA